jgi:hypothetical protein
LVFINDPVNGVNYVLNTKERTAEKTEVHVVTDTSGTGDPQAEKGVIQWKAEHPGGAPRTNMIFRSERREVKQGEEGELHDVTVATSAVGPDFSFTDDNAKTESLGKQMIEGVEADGARTTITIPAGQIGNERPIEIVSESWYSPQLKTLVRSKQSDPRMGETTYRLTNVQLVEPLPSMFEVPADYTIQEGPQMKFFERKLPPPNEGQPEPGR